jgi:hypothetical protein
MHLLMHVACQGYVVVKLLRIWLNWRSYLSNLPSAVTGKAEDEWAGATACLREPGGSMFYDRSLDFSLFVAAEGFLGGMSL